MISSQYFFFHPVNEHCQNERIWKVQQNGGEFLWEAINRGLQNLFPGGIELLFDCLFACLFVCLYK